MPILSKDAESRRCGVVVHVQGVPLEGKINRIDHG